MKVGDKLYCINDRKYIGSPINISGKIYEILAINSYKNTTTITMSNEIGDQSFYYSLKNNTEHYYIYNYFMTIKEMRKLKLKKINESWR